MPAQLEIEEEVIHRQRERSAAERRWRNALAISEIVGRNPAKNPPKPLFQLPRRPPQGRN